MIEIKTIKELKELSEAGFKDDIFGFCEICNVRIPLKYWSIKRKLKKEKLLCKGCSVSYEKGKYSEENKQMIKEKRKRSNIEKYGVENTWQLEKVKKMSSNRDWTERNKNTVISCQKKYGKDVINPAQTLASKENAKKTLIERYGSVENSYKQRVEKSKDTFMAHYGVDHNFKSKEWKEKTNQTIINKYGRMIYSRTYIYNDICFDSSWELAYYIWLSDAKFQFEYQPVAQFKYLGSDGLEHSYYPDFMVNGEYQEIKGDQFFNDKDEPYCEITKEYWWEKYNFIKDTNVKLLRYKDLKPIIEYVHKTYGKDYLKSFKVKLKKD